MMKNSTAQVSSKENDHCINAMLVFLYKVIFMYSDPISKSTHNNSVHQFNVTNRVLNYYVAQAFVLTLPIQQKLLDANSFLVE